jgi:hypothetical protein
MSEKDTNVIETKSINLGHLPDYEISVHTKTLKRWYQLINLGRLLDKKAANVTLKIFIGMVLRD